MSTTMPVISAARVKKILTGLCSALIVALGVAYVVSPVDVSTAMSVELVDGPQPYDHDARVIYPGAAQGAIVSRGQDRAAAVACGGTACGGAIRAAAARSRPAPRRDREVITARIDSNLVVRKPRLHFVGILPHAARGARALVVMRTSGTVRAVLRLRHGYYRVRFTGLIGGRTRTLTRHVHLVDGHHYRFNIRVRANGLPVAVPVVTY